MANVKSRQLQPDFRPQKGEYYGKMRVIQFDVDQGATAGAANDTYELCKLPAGFVTVLLTQSIIKTTAFGSGRTLDIGHGAYQKGLEDNVSADLDAFMDGASISTAGKDYFVSPTSTSGNLKYGLYSQNGVTVTAQVKGGTIPANAKIEGYMVIVTE